MVVNLVLSYVSYDSLMLDLCPDKINRLRRGVSPGTVLTYFFELEPVSALDDFLHKFVVVAETLEPKLSVFLALVKLTLRQDYFVQSCVHLGFYKRYEFF